MQKSDFEQKFQKNMSKYLAGQQRDLLDYLWSLDRQDDLGELFGVLVRFPENLFGLFPGMGAYSLLARRLGAAMAEEMILSARTYTADEMKDAGLVHIVAEPGGVDAARDYIGKSKRRHTGSRAVFEAGRAVAPISLAESDRIVDNWADACLELRERDLKVMERLVSAQNKLQPALQAAE
jgi:DSF synthase